MNDNLSPSLYANANFTSLEEGINKLKTIDYGFRTLSNTVLGSEFVLEDDFWNWFELFCLLSSSLHDLLHIVIHDFYSTINTSIDN